MRGLVMGCVVALALLAGAMREAGADTVAAMGIGVQECSFWVDIRQHTLTHSDENRQARSWILGYISGQAQALDVDYLRETVADSIFILIDRECELRPRQDIVEDRASALAMFTRLVDSGPALGVATLVP